tara:strand:+ start:547 stop:912 length:366 start_codon:yes stop_codon:yes gene_type:complete
MPYVLQIELKHINDSLAIGDTVYYSATQTINEFSVDATGTEGIIKIGECSAINIEQGFIRVSGDLNIDPPTADQYLFFSKDNAANLSTIKGYYAEVKIKNDNKTTDSELFQITLNATQSSK